MNVAMKSLFVVVFFAFSIDVQAAKSLVEIPLGIFGAQARKTVLGKPWVAYAIMKAK